MTALICGSLAYDNIMVFPGRFKEQILPDRIHILNVAFLVPELRREFGGCAGNIAYNLHGIGGQGVPMGTVGRDFDPYRQWLTERGIDTRYVLDVPESLTAQAYITTDLDDNQITAFHPGAMEMSHRNAVPSDAGITLGIVSPDGKQGMLEHARQFAQAGIPFIFDPGQGLPMFDAQELAEFLELATWVVVNDYEAGMLQQKTGLSLAQTVERVDALVVTRGGEGSRVHLPSGETLEIPVVAPEKVLDPTGCGDAYRAGVLYGLMHGADWQTTGRLASLLGSLKIAHYGTQNHPLSPQQVRDRFRQAFGFELGLGS